MNNVTKDLIININRGILDEWLEENPTEFEGMAHDEEKLDRILKEIEEQDSIIGKAAYLMASIAWSQPFAGRNKRTAFTCADTLLRLNGQKLVIKSKKDEEYLRKLLFEIQDERSKLNPYTIAKIVLYVSKRIEKYESKRV